MKKNLLPVFLALFLLLSCTQSQPLEGEAKAAGKTAGAALKCHSSGCSAEACVPEGKSVNSPCIFLPQYGCLKKSRCEVQPSGECGWSQTGEYQKCLEGVTGSLVPQIQE